MIPDSERLRIAALRALLERGDPERGEADDANRSEPSDPLLDSRRTLTLYRDEQDAIGTPHVITWRTWIAGLRDAVRGVTAAAPATFDRCPADRPDPKTGEPCATCHGLRPAPQHRLDANAHSIGALVLDYDGGEKGARPTSIEDARALWPFAGVLYTTKSHMRAKDGAAAVPRFRVWLFLPRPVNAAEHAALMRWALARAEGAGHVLDRRCRNPSRLWFLARADAVVIELDNPALDIDAALAAEPDEPAPERVATPPLLIGPNPAGRPSVESRCRAKLRTVGPSIQGQNGSASLAKAASFVVGFMRPGDGLSEAQAVACLEEWSSDYASPPWSEGEIMHALSNMLTKGRNIAPGSMIDQHRPGFAPVRPPAAEVIRDAAQLPADDQEPADHEAPQTDPSEQPANDAQEAQGEPTSTPDEQPPTLTTAEPVAPPSEPGGGGGNPALDAAPDSDAPPKVKPDLRLVRPPGDGGGKANAPRPDIVVKPGRLDLAFTASIAALAGRPDLNLYVRKGEGDLVRVSEAPRAAPSKPGAPRRAVFCEGSPRLFDVSLAHVLGRLCEVAAFKKQKQTGRIEDCDPPHDVCKMVLDKGACIGRLDTLTGIIETPTMRPDGSILSAPGYDSATGYYLALSGDWPAMPAQPSQADAIAARERLEDVFCDFPWEHLSGRTVALAALLTIIARPAIVGATPCFIFDANEPGFGKSLTVQTVGAIATGRVGDPLTYPSNRDKSDEEVEKLQAGAAMGGARMLWWDDLDPRNPFGGSSLQKTLTARDTVLLRKLGSTGNYTFPWFAVTLATGNNVQTTTDMERRSYRARVLSRWENSAARPLSDYNHPERKGVLIEYVLQRRGQLVADALTILRAYVVAGSPLGATLDHEGYEAWSRVVSCALEWAGAPSLGKRRVSAAKQKCPERCALETLCAYWNALAASMGVKAGAGVQLGKAIAHLYPHVGVRDSAPPDDVFNHLREALETLDPKHRSGTAPEKSTIGLMLRRKGNGVYIVDEYDGTPAGKPGVARSFRSEASTRGGVSWRVVDPNTEPNENEADNG